MKPVPPGHVHTGAHPEPATFSSLTEGLRDGQLHRERLRGIESFFDPGSVAVAGVSTDPDKMGSIIFANMLANRKKGLLRAKVYALNPTHDRIGDEPCYRSMGALPETPELLIVAVPESMTLPLIREAGRAGVKAAVMVTSGYAEAGKGEVESAIGGEAARHGMRILGPNTIGLVDTRTGVDSLFLRPTKRLPDGSEVASLLSPLKGDIAIITQSGHLGETISEELASNGVGIRALVGTGNQLDVSVEDVMEYFADDHDTRVMAVYIEGIREGRRFMQVARHASGRRPVVVFKVGKTDVGARAALTHTASMVGDYEVYRAAFRQSGLIEAGTIQELVDYSVALSMLPRAAGDRLVIVTNAGGVGAIAADEARRLGLRVDQLGEGAKRKLRSVFAGEAFASNASFANPVDLTASVTTEQLVRATKAVLALDECDAVIVMPTHQTPAIGYDVAQRVADATSRVKPLIACVTGKAELAGRIHREFIARGIPSFPTPERAVRALAAAVSYAKVEGGAKPALPRRRRQAVRLGRGGPMDASEVSRLLRAYGIEEPRSVIVRSSKDLGAVRKLDFPVACKLLSEGLVHKSDAGGVVLNVRDEGGARGAFARFKRTAERKGVHLRGMLVQEMVGGSTELILGGTRDATFGPVVVLGLGGIFTEVLRDFGLAVAPVSPEEARDTLLRGRVGKILAGYRGGARVDPGRLAEVVSSFSRIMAENPRIGQMEVNPLMAKGDKILAADARVIIGPPVMPPPGGAPRRG